MCNDELVTINFLPSDCDFWRICYKIEIINKTVLLPDITNACKYAITSSLKHPESALVYSISTESPITPKANAW